VEEKDPKRLAELTKKAVQAIKEPKYCNSMEEVEKFM